MSTRRVNSFDAAVEPIGLADIWIRQVFSQQARPRKLHGVSVLDDLMCWVPPTLGNFVFVQGKDGQVGFWGPIDDITGLLILRVLRPYLLTKSALTIENLLASCRSVLRHALCGDGIVAVSSVELAFWDLQGKRKGLPVHRLLSGKSHSTICYASLLGVDPRDKRITRACRETIGLGFTGVKISFRRLKGRTRATDALRAVERIRRECGDILLMVDCHGQWTLSEAVAFCSGAKSLDLHWVEEPICPRSFGEYSVLTRRTQIPIAAGEHAYTAYELSLLAEIGVAVLQPDV